MILSAEAESFRKTFEGVIEDEMVFVHHKSKGKRCCAALEGSPLLELLNAD